MNMFKNVWNEIMILNINYGNYNLKITGMGSKCKTVRVSPVGDTSLSSKQITFQINDVQKVAYN